MPQSLPSLKAIRAFECVARHLSFTLAADELCVTQGAVSRQVRLLEEELGKALLVREGSKVALTEAGAEYFGVACEALSSLKQATHRVRAYNDAPAFTISALPSLANHWLVPRLARLQANWPQVSLRTTTSYEAIDFDRNPEVNVAIRFGEGGFGNLFEEQLTDDHVYPVCSPVFLERHSKFRAPGDICAEQLLVGVADTHDWKRWFAATETPMPPTTGQPGYGDASLAMNAALEGRGLILGRALIVGDHLRKGNLVRPFAANIRSSYNYFFVCPAAFQRQQQASDFLAWLKGEVATTQTTVRCAAALFN